MTEIHRHGAVGALLDEYERAINELKNTISTLDQKSFLTIVDSETKDKDCKSIQSVINHVIMSGWFYADCIREQFGDTIDLSYKIDEIDTIEKALAELDYMFTYTEETLNNKYNLTLDDILNNIMKLPVGQSYDFEQLLEHAIVHILRHRRQIEKFKSKIKSAKQTI